MALTGWSTANYLNHAAGVTSTRPFLLSAWGYRTATANGRAVEIGVSGSNNNRRSIAKDVSNFANVIERGTTTGTGATTTTITVNTWAQISGWFVDNVTREVQLNGGGLNTAAGDVTPSAPDTTRIGLSAEGFVPWDNAGALAEASVWDGTGLTETQRRTLDTLLAAGDNPLALDASGDYAGLLVAYWPLVDDTDLADAKAAFDMTMVGTLTTFGSHPTIDPPPGAATAGAAIQQHMSRSMVSRARKFFNIPFLIRPSLADVLAYGR